MLQVLANGRHEKTKGFIRYASGFPKRLKPSYVLACQNVKLKKIVQHTSLNILVKSSKTGTESFRTLT